MHVDSYIRNIRQEPTFSHNKLSTCAWNSLPETVVSACTLSTFKQKLDEFWNRIRYGWLHNLICYSHSYIYIYIYIYILAFSQLATKTIWLQQLYMHIYASQLQLTTCSHLAILLWSVSFTKQYSSGDPYEIQVASQLQLQASSAKFRSYHFQIEVSKCWSAGSLISKCNLATILTSQLYILENGYNQLAIRINKSYSYNN